MTYKPTTLAARAGEHAKETPSRPLVEPIYQNTVFAFDDLDHMEQVFSEQTPSNGGIYYRFNTPNHLTLEGALAALEKTEDAVCAASGMAAIAAALQAVLQQGDHLIADQQAYGGTYTLLTQELPRWGIEVTLLDITDAEAVEQAITPRTRLIHVESLTNPLMTTVNFPALIELAHSKGVLVSVDNTFATPALFRPAEHGADLVSHSLSKYLSGHSNALGGALAGRKDLIQQARLRLIRQGATLSAFDAWITLQGLKTLGLRMRAHTHNAQAVADVLSNHPRVAAVYHPGLGDHPQFDLAADLFPDGFAGMLSFELRGDLNTFIRRLQGKIPLAPSLADVNTTLSYPWTTSHRSLSEQRKLELGIRPSLLRLSVGIEDIEDILDDLEDALNH
ncbi:trans-sulfuration enzyme family protein [Deinococcus roseus]|uniref:O-succinylhomoserine sulfhydrylase n=1 Tax=Deinococcus roseus TaxID=392414 RepID=A0ABQ2CVC7_9DEIO|nr:aminotransferase class I/II-fold pyridoxal phosphate-dependent enzyme [Deinococcus roseus]GGJ24621.1 O-succinylhomoserine sulfhydrylase [Deinococcus roseus]